MKASHSTMMEVEEQEVSHTPADQGEEEIEFEVVLAYLERVCPANDLKTADEPIPCTIFHGQHVPDISFRGYLERIKTFSGCSPACLVVAVSYLEHLGEIDADMRVNSINMHRLVLTATMVACKLFDENFYCNAYWARVGGVPASEMNKLELEFLFQIKFDLYRTGDEYKQILQRLVTDMNRERAPVPPKKWKDSHTTRNTMVVGEEGQESPTNVVLGAAEVDNRWHRKAVEGALIMRQGSTGSEASRLVQGADEEMAG